MRIRAGAVTIVLMEERPLEVCGSAAARAGLVTVLVATPDLLLGEFRCPCDDELWAVENDIGDLHHVVWPWTTVEIHRAGFGTVCADANTVMLYNPGTEYRRSRIAPAGDRSLFVALSASLLDRLQSPLVRAKRGGFSRGHVWCSSSAWLDKELTAAAAAKRLADPLLLEELALRSLFKALGDPAADEANVPQAARLRERVEAARSMLGADLDATFQVTSIARQLEVSPFHLARQFRATTGTSMYAYRQQLRVRRAIRHAIAEPTRDLSAIAAEHGFASHSHLTATCRRLLGCTPSTARKAVASTCQEGSPSGRWRRS